VKQLIMINGAMGVGKTCVCKGLNKRLENSVWLDGDWCMMMNPWKISESTQKMFLDNIIYLLKNFLANPTFAYVLFSWVIPREDLSGYIVKKMREHDLSFELKKITLMCSDDRLKKRMRLDGRDANTIEKSIVYQDAFRSMDTIKVDTTGLTLSETIDTLLKII
jgi:broad-specificity NMP kinase